MGEIKEGDQGFGFKRIAAQVLRITGHDRQGVPRQRLALPVTAGSGIREIFREREKMGIGQV